MATPREIAVHQTASFIDANIAPASSLLEVGCGDGHVALALQNAGHRVLGVDSDPAAVARARRLGAVVEYARWPEFSGATVTAVAFTRSLHHIHPLDQAVERACSFMAAGGMLVLEDFAYDEIDAATLDWLLGTLRSDRMQGLVGAAPNPFEELLAAPHPLTAWRAYHDHALHRFGDMQRVIALHFAVETVLTVPYLYRYLVASLPETEEAGDFLRETLDDERARVAHGEIVGIGRRLVARKIA